MTETIIRRACPGDTAALARFNREMAFETEGLELLPEVIGAGVTALLENPGMGFYAVAESGGEVVGSLMVTTEWSDWRNGIFWWIQSVYVLPGHRRRGIYRQLYEFVKSEAGMADRVCGFRLYVERDNLVAQQTYRSLGMEETHYRMYEALKPGARFSKD